MSKDVLFIIFDSLCQKNIGINYSGVSTTPFIDALARKSYVCKNVYSQGPYTEAGTKALLCGEDTLSSGGYLLRYANSSSFITDEFFDNNYETYCYMYPSALLSKTTLSKTNHMIYTSGFEFNTLWRQKLSFYADLFDKGELFEKDYKKCIDIMNVVFCSWNAFLNPRDEKEAYRLIANYVEGYDFSKNRELLRKEISLFQKNNKEYVKALFSQKEMHSIFKIENIDMTKMIANNTIREAFLKNKTLQKKYRVLQKKLNKKNNKYPIALQIKDFVSSIVFHNKYLVGKAYNYYQLLNEAKDIDICIQKNNFKTIVSTRSIFNDLKDILSKPSEKKKFIFVHTEDTHYFSTFFSYDSNDADTINEELNYAEEYLENVSALYRGHLMYDLSIRYVDKETQKLFDYLNDSCDNSTPITIITADHGYSYNRYPLRERLVNNFHAENYIIPFIFYDSGKIVGTNSNFVSSKDIVASIYDYCEMKVNNSVNGISVFKEDYKRKFVLTEYMGPGCPDLERREAWISARNEHRMIAAKYKLSSKEAFGEKHIIEVYNLDVDPLETKNLHVLDDECQCLFEAILKRIDVLKEEIK